MEVAVGVVVEEVVEEVAEVVAEVVEDLLDQHPRSVRSPIRPLDNYVDRRLPIPMSFSNVQRGRLEVFQPQQGTTASVQPYRP